MGDRRALVLRTIRTARSPVGIADLSERIGLHPNTIRYHLDGLEAAGLIRRLAGTRTGIGRPRTAYEATAASVLAGPRNYATLAAILAACLAEHLADPAQAAHDAGHAWGATLPPPVSPRGTSAAATARRHLVTTMTDMGFEPEPSPARRPRELLIHNCPFQDVAARHQEIVCAVHLGLMRGLLARSGGGVAVRTLEPYAAPGLCRAQLASALPQSAR
ncbi:MAG: helix-turn-helix domain-containing protein [Tetrasphaera sp.]